jgi:hypothetical protein
MMKRWIVAVAVAASFSLPLASQAQPAGGPGPGGGPPPEARAKMEKIVGDARVAALNVLAPEHRDGVRMIIGEVAARSVDPRAGAQKIDALLSADERTRLTAVEQKMRTDMRTAMAGMPAPPGGGPPPGAGPPGGGPPAGPGFAGRAPDPGRFLLMVSRSLRFHGPEPRSSGAP